ncbi:MAG: pilus assembly protein PilP [Deltaproteobacteria bacterium]|jgi:type IV pilus assembly protein PilP
MKIAATSRNWLLGLMLLVLPAAGCGDRPESETSRQPLELRKKIATPQKPGAAAVKSMQTAKAAVPEGKDPVQPPSEQTKLEPPAPEKKGLIQPDKSSSPQLVSSVGKKPTYFYDPTGKADPFRPLFAQVTERFVPAQQKVKRQRLPLTPLQRVDLGQFKLVGIVLSREGNKALVEEPSGKGYIISKGTYIGQNFGRVKRILKDKVVVEEEVEDFLSGEMKLQATELKLQKKVGDG